MFEWLCREDMSELSYEQRNALKKALWITKKAGEEERFIVKDTQCIIRTYKDPWKSEFLIRYGVFDGGLQKRVTVYDILRDRCLMSAVCNDGKWSVYRFDNIVMWDLFLEACIADVKANR